MMRETDMIISNLMIEHFKVLVRKSSVLMTHPAIKLVHHIIEKKTTVTQNSTIVLTMRTTLMTTVAVPHIKSRVVTMKVIQTP